MWSGGEAPICEGESEFNLICVKTNKFAAIHCSPIELIVNGSIIYASDMTANFDLGTEATYSCNTGFFLDVSKGNRIRACLEGNGMDAIGMWSGQPPTCVCKLQ